MLTTDDMLEVIKGNTHQLKVQSDLKKYQLFAQGIVDVEIQTIPNNDGNIYIEITGNDVDLRVRGVMEQDSHTKVVWVNRTFGTLKFIQDIQVKKDAMFKMGFADLEAVILNANINVLLVEQGASTELLTVSRVSEHKFCRVNVIHEVMNTTSDTQNFAIVNEHGDYKMETIGEIKKGAVASSCHQASRVLTTSSQQTSDVLPVLLIDENDVKASHATTVGQPDAQQLYYLQSRGLTREQAMGLLTIGYLLPISEVIENKELQEELKKYIEKKVGLHV